MLKEFQECLEKNGQIKANSGPYYVKWVVDCYSFLDKPISEITYNEENPQTCLPNRPACLLADTSASRDIRIKKDLPSGRLEFYPKGGRGFIQKNQS